MKKVVSRLNTRPSLHATGDAGESDRSPHPDAAPRREHIAELDKRAAETGLRLKQLYDAIESGVADLV